jgi:D-arabinose 1-dehydrogenase-like Zn-dependent alcohol dehydrogenase
MRAAVMEAVRKPLVIRDMPMPKPDGHGVLLRIEANGICRSDWHTWVGDWDWIGAVIELPYVIGHEFAGVIEEVGAHVTRFRKGDRVIVPQAMGEGTCEMCRHGHHNICDAGVFAGWNFWGGFGRYAAVPYADANLIPMPESMGFVEAAGLGCRFGTSFQGIVNQVKVRPGEWVAVHGCGGIGLSAVHIANAIGARVIAVDIDARKLAFAEELGAEATVDAKAGDPGGQVREITKGGAHVSVDALGIRATCQNAVASLRRRGRHLQAGLTGSDERGEIKLPIDRIVESEISIVGTLSLPAPGYPAMMTMIERGKLAPGKLVTKRVTLEESIDVLASMDRFATLGFVVIDRY